jgi:hypothetical protein
LNPEKEHKKALFIPFTIPDSSLYFNSLLDYFSFLLSESLAIMIKTFSAVDPEIFFKMIEFMQPSKQFHLTSFINIVPMTRYSNLGETIFSTVLTFLTQHEFKNIIKLINDYNSADNFPFNLHVVAQSFLYSFHNYHYSNAMLFPSFNRSRLPNYQPFAKMLEESIDLLFMNVTSITIDMVPLHHSRIVSTIIDSLSLTEGKKSSFPKFQSSFSYSDLCKQLSMLQSTETTKPIKHTK